MLRKYIILCLFAAPLSMRAQTDISWEVAAQTTNSSGDHTPLWLNANKHGLSSLDKNNGYLMAGVEKTMTGDSIRKWSYGFGASMAAAYGFTSPIVVQEAYVEGRWLKGVLTLGSKEWAMELKNDTLSSGSQTFGINARPVPQLRIALPDFIGRNLFFSIDVSPLVFIWNLAKNLDYVESFLKKSISCGIFQPQNL